MGQKLMRVKHRVPVSPLPRGWTHAVEDEIVGRLAARIEAVLLRMEQRIGRAAAVQLGEQRTEPVRVLVVNPDHVVTPAASDAASSAARSMRSTSAGSGTPARN